MKKVIVLASAVLALAGCAAGRQASPKVGYYDLGAAAAPAGRARQGLPSLRDIEVFAPSWLNTAALQYRLAYQGDQRRQNYAESRWVAPPAELVGHLLRKRMLSGDTMGACKLRIDLDEFVHFFDAADASRSVVEARVQLLGPGGELLARRAVIAGQPAPGADARGGAAALSGAVEDLAATLLDWLGGLERETRPGSGIVDRCRGA